MARLLSDIPFTGSLGNISAYKMKGSDKIILRKKGGASKEKIKKAKEFETTRKLNAEFGGRSVGSKYIMHAMFPLKALADYNFAGPLNALIKPIQAMDTKSDHGKRNIYFTRHPKLLEGFSLNQRNPFDSIVRNPVSCRLDKKNMSAAIEMPALIPGINFFVPPGRHPLYSIIIVLGIVPDITFTKYGYKPLAVLDPGHAASSWYPVSKGSQATALEVSLQWQGHKLPVSAFSLMLSIGIRFGTVGMNDAVEQVKYAGAAKVLVVE
ncbi:MAG TPA: hypothetical protein VGD17_19575 [Chitinophagaceae bacterium]